MLPCSGYVFSQLLLSFRESGAERFLKLNNDIAVIGVRTSALFALSASNADELFYASRIFGDRVCAGE